jgi:hypothetical protein
LAISQEFSNVPSNTLGTTTGIKKMVIISKVTINPTELPTWLFAVATIIGIKGAPPLNESGLKID